MRNIRAIFNYADKNYLVEVPLRKLWGTEIEKPGKKTIKKEKNANPKRFIEAGEIRRLIDQSTATMKVMLLLAVNFGFGNTDVGSPEYDKGICQAREESRREAGRR